MLTRARKHYRNTSLFYLEIVVQILIVCEEISMDLIALLCSSQFLKKKKPTFLEKNYYI